jgi:hypothetical protein
VNAADLATSIAAVSKISAIVNLFKATFPQVKVDLKPWLTDQQTVRFIDATSLDFAFHFADRNPTCQCHSILMQVQLCCGGMKAIGIELSGHDFEGQQWEMSTQVEYWRFVGHNLPSVTAAVQLECICRDILAIFNHPVAPEKQRGNR